MQKCILNILMFFRINCMENIEEVWMVKQTSQNEFAFCQKYYFEFEKLWQLVENRKIEIATKKLDKKFFIIFTV